MCEFKEAGTYEYEKGTVTVVRPVLSKEEYEKREQEFKAAVARYAGNLRAQGYAIGQRIPKEGGKL